jgi:hypothetical protein
MGGTVLGATVSGGPLPREITITLAMWPKRHEFHIAKAGIAWRLARYSFESASNARPKPLNDNGTPTP